MKVPNTAAVASAASMWIEDDVLRVQAHGVTSDRTAVLEVLEVITDLTEGRRLPVLADVREWPVIDAEAWTEIWIHIRDFATAAAAVIDPARAAPVIAFAETVNRLLIPAKVVSTEDEGLEFLRSTEARESEPIITGLESVQLVDGIVRVTAKGGAADAEVLDRTLDAVRSLTRNQPRPVLFDARIPPAFDESAWRTLIDQMQSAFTVGALLIDPNRPPELGDRIDVIDRFVMPIRVFTEESEAVAFLRDPPETPKHVIVTSSGTELWIEGGIVHVRTRGTAPTAESAAEAVVALRELVGGTPRPVLIDARQLQSPSPGAWAEMIANLKSLFSAIAVVVDAEHPVDLGEYPDIIDRLLVPHRIFTDEGEAGRFLSEAKDTDSETFD